MKNTRPLFATLILFTVLLAGCGKGSSAPGKVSGKVTYQNTPLAAGTITFHTKAGMYGPTPIQPDGTYSLAQLPVGEADVTIETESANTKKPLPTYGGAQGKNNMPMTSPKPESMVAPPAGEYRKIPAKYSVATTSGLKVTLTAGAQTHNFDLKD